MRFLFFIFFVILSVTNTSAQTSGYSGTGSNIDVDNYQIYWRINPDSALGIKGVVKIKFKTTVNAVNRISFDLRSVHIIDDIIFRGVSISASRSGNTFTIPAAIPVAGTRDSVTIFYHGAPPTANQAETGFTKTTGAGGNVIYTLSESYEDRDWWPCKADMQDKADTIDITVNVPYCTNNATVALATDTFWVASNGTLIDSTIDISGTQAQRNRTFTYINRYPMTSYLVCLGIARYTRFYKGTVQVGGFETPVVYYLYAGKSAATYTSIVAAMDTATKIVTKFAPLFGNYPYPDPLKGGKHGFYEGCPGGAMEHQTFSAMSTGSLQSKSTLVHELTHQWFGDKVSFATWNDLWLAEAFAEYSPSLAAEFVGMGFTPFSARNSLKSTALQQTAPVYIPNSGIASSNTIWNGSGTVAYGSSVYQRGAMVVSMLRTLCGDTMFFNILRDYQTSPNLAYKTANYDTIRQRFVDSIGLDISQFFEDNVKGTGYANYNILYGIAGVGNKTLLLGVGSQSQQRNNPSIPPASTVAYFNNPIVVHVKGALPTEDTTVVFFDWGNGVLSKAGKGVGPQITGNSLSYNLSFTPITFAYDDSARTMSLGTMVPSTILSVNLVDFEVKKQQNLHIASLVLAGSKSNEIAKLERGGDGINFSEIGNMNRSNENNGNTTFTFADNNPLPFVNFYRAKFRNDIEEYKYSSIIKINTNKTQQVTLLYNVVKNNLQLNTTSIIGKNILVEIFDGSAKLVAKKMIKNAGTIESISLINKSAGLYVAKVTISNQLVETIQFVVQ